MSTLDKTRIAEVIEACVENIDRLSKWERGFIQSISDQYDRKRWLSEAQEDILERIYISKVP